MDVGRHPRIELLAYSQVETVQGSAGHFDVQVRKQARYVREDECTACGICLEKCPGKAPDAFNLGLNQRKAIYQYFPQGIPAVMTIDRDNCLHFTKGICRVCEKLCDKQAIDFDQTDEVLHRKVGSIILSTGFEPFSPSSLAQYSYRKHPDVITAMEFERLVSASGPTDGELRRPSDGGEVERVAFVQCVGSRDVRTNSHCSAVCCMFAVKEAILANEHDPRVESYLFYTDLRASGKGFQEYLMRGENEYKVHYVRGRVAKITSDPQGRPRLWYEDTQARHQKRLEVDLVVLVNSLVPSSGIRQLAQTLGIALDARGFVQTDPYSPTETSVEGIFACGYCESPMDIPSSVAQAGGASARALEVVTRVRSEKLL